MLNWLEGLWGLMAVFAVPVFWIALVPVAIAFWLAVRALVRLLNKLDV